MSAIWTSLNILKQNWLVSILIINIVSLNIRLLQQYIQTMYVFYTIINTEINTSNDMLHLKVHKMQVRDMPPKLVCQIQ